MEVNIRNERHRYRRFFCEKSYAILTIMPDIFQNILGSTAKKVCVIAAPGSGKTTRILIPKAQGLLSDGIDGKEILLLTFSRLSALDLKEKVKPLGTPRASTVHSFCLSFLLSEDNHEIRDRVDSIVLDFEKGALLADLKLVFPNRSKPALRRELGMFSAGWATQPHDQVFEETNDRRTFKFAVTKWLSEHRAAMMEEIVYFAVDLAGKIGAPEYLRQSKYVFVDEFQDLNKLEQAFIELLAAEANLLLVVGDPDQSIYSFKYAHPEGIQEFAGRSSVERHASTITGRCGARIVAAANQLLQQADPSRTALVQSMDTAGEGETHFVRKLHQAAEFEYVLKSIQGRLSGDTPCEAKEIIVLVPRRKLGGEFTEYANQRKAQFGIAESTDFSLVHPPEFTPVEQEQLLLFALLVQPNSLLHLRTYLGLPDDPRWFAAELKNVTVRYGGLENVLESANADNFPKKQKRLRALCERVANLRLSLAQDIQAESLNATLERLFPAQNPDLAELRAVIDRLLEPDDSPESLYRKLVDYTRTVPGRENAIRVMTLMASKGLQADHVYIIGCSAGNIPGKKWSPTLTDEQHRDEQRRLLYVGFTRAKKSLSVSWSQYIPYSQAMQQQTQSVAIRKFAGQTYGKVGLSPFLQDLSGITWET